MTHDDRNNINKTGWEDSDEAHGSFVMITGGKLLEKIVGK